MENCLQGHQGGLAAGREVVMDSEGQSEYGEEDWGQCEITCVCTGVHGKGQGGGCPASAAGVAAGLKSRGPGQTNVGLSLGTIMTSCSVTLTSHFTSLKSGVVVVQSLSHV